MIDFHTHAFSDDLAPKAMKALSSGCPDLPYYLDGTVKQLLESMDKAGISKSVICSIATKPKQFAPIFDWSIAIQSDRIIPLASVHPLDEQRDEHIKQVKDAGLKGLKLHPYYQDFYVDEDNMLKYYEQVCKHDLVLTVHTGYDVAFPYIRRAEPARILNALKHFPQLKFVTTHLGAWQMWDEVENELLGKNVYIEISFALEYLSEKRAKQILENHPEDYILFGSDSPWTDQRQTLNLLNKLKLSPERMGKILSANAKNLLHF
ncbi:MAG TPA: amidohydrolase [Phycisphaerales bacterium]|nr:amidohydrolase [Phycisphaerales bacterium]HBR19660.1 amidohydrolase [Phycisphaerales bacterium]